LVLWIKSIRVCTRSPYSKSTRWTNLGKIRRRRGIKVIKRRVIVLKQGERIENRPPLPRVTRKRNFRITEML
jgi:hypothetical protein